ncbi:TPA: hypothetical protein ACPZZU_004073 [Klebsiella pneumoniae]|uniref:hypothetical protein n=1 Tax=Klebsiella pneumoniae TaxID=573 RepID=UPI0002C415CA|nr:hypothetical protein [Klebsiella pneumoniae]AHI37382.1 hypothetical protein Kpn2146_4018 [Klebsiella pneumoniae]APR47276.1 hypothetical protein AM428_11375 [Klebsiella pneumoniae]EIV5269900.1 hypothetical protein [Klebsiella pneumoniae]EIV6146783.1 hypothetical protein [Klebsiella pneumoniae]EJA2183160.1 hypothetical protein [Klebsiella pneumoniae]
MTDITELAQRLKLDVHRAVSNFNPQMNIKTRDLKELVEALEKAQRYIEELREWNAGLAQESCERQQRISELLEGKVGNALLERENHHVELVGKLAERIAELESRAVTFKLPSTPEPSAFAPWVAKAFYQFHKDTVKSCVAVFSDACRAAGIKVEAE